MRARLCLRVRRRGMPLLRPPVGVLGLAQWRQPMQRLPDLS